MNRADVSLLSVGLGVLMVATFIEAADSPHWRGPGQNGASAESGLPEDWSPDGENLLWKAAVGCRSTPVVLNDRVYLINRVGEGAHRQERVMALDLNTGEIVWEHRFNVFLTDIVFHRVGWANIIADPETGYVYAHGIQGMLFCFDKDGKIIWKRSLTEELGRISGYGGRTNSPIIENNLLIISSLTSGWGPHGRGLHRFVAMDKRTGEIQWWSAPSGAPLDTTYSVPITTTLDGQRVMLTGLADGTIVAMRPSTGERLWQFKLSKRGISSSVVHGDGRVYGAHSEENLDSVMMGRVVCLDAHTGKEIWRVDGLACGYASLSLDDGLLYVPGNAANLHCIDAVSGERLWEFNYGNEAKGSPMIADGKAYVGDGHGSWSILKVSREGCESLSKVHFKLPDGSPDEVYATPAIAHGRVIMPTMHNIYCASGKAADFRSPGEAVRFGADAKIEAGPLAHVQIVPAEAWAAPGEQLSFSLQGFDADGNALGPVEGASFSTKNLAGSVAPDGTFTAAGDRILAGAVIGKAGDMTSSARVRVVPPLPYKQDFENGKPGLPPAGWITSKLKCQVAEHEGGKVLRKLADRPAPPFARLRCYITPPVASGYTIQSDILGVPKKKRLLPDMGLINSRYLLILAGTSERTRKLRLVSWAPVPRIISEIDFPWIGDTWYTARLSVDVAEGKGVVRAKVWARGGDEPEAWSLEMTDPAPNLEGSPGLYAYSVGVTEKSKGTEVLFDNVLIERN
jgi:outer membrane protein assembly factor BamB